MVVFIFAVNKSFLEYVNHPITIPHGCHDDLIKEIFDGKGKRNLPLCICAPTGRKLDGHIYYGVTGGNPYYQLKVLGSYPSDYFGHLIIGDHVFVRIEKRCEQVFADISSAKDLERRFIRRAGLP